MTCKTDVPFPSVEPLGRMLDLAAVELIDVDVENLSTVERDFDRLPADFHFLVIPLTNRAQIAMLGSDAMIEGAMVLKRLERCVWMLCIVPVAIDDLQLNSIR